MVKKQIIKYYEEIYLLILFLFFSVVTNAQTNMGDVNNDGNLNILVLGTTESINNNSEEFSPYQIAIELQNILLGCKIATLN